MTLADWLDARRAARAEAGLTRRLRPRPAPDGAPASVDLAGNDYLGLGRHPAVTDAAADAARVWGAGAGASRLVTGTLDVHAELETAIASFAGRPAALSLSTGYHANLSAVTALCDAETLIVSDAHVHASLIDACRLARPGALVVTPHNDVSAVASALDARGARRALVLVESVYSVLGDAAPLSALADVASAHAAVLIVDEAHALGVAGRGGRGLVDAAGLADQPFVVSTGTLSKAFGSQGGVILATPAVIEHVVNTARPFIYDTGLAPPAAAAAQAAIAIVEGDPALPGRALAAAARMAAAAGQAPPAGAVLSIPMPGPREALDAQAALAADGFTVGCFRPPSAPDGVSRLRLTARATLAEHEVDGVARSLSALVPASR